MSSLNHASVQVREYPDDSEQGYQTLTIRSHWNERDKVVLEIEGKSWTFVGSDIEAAIDAVRSARR